MHSKKVNRSHHLLETDLNLCTCARHMVPQCWIKLSSCILHIINSIFSLDVQNIAEKQKCSSDISSLLGFSQSLAPLGPSGQTSGGSANRVGDVRPHHQGVEGIGFPWFPHLRPTEARERCEQCCLSVPVCFFPPSVSFSFSRLYILKHSWFHLFMHSSGSPFFFQGRSVSFSFSLARHYHMQG